MFRIIHTESSCGWGGQEIRILSEIEGMLARGHRVTLISPAHSKIFLEAQKKNMDVLPSPIERKNLKGLIGMHKSLHQIGDVDIINTHSSTDSWLATLSSLFSHKKTRIIRTRHVSTPIANNLPTKWLYINKAAYIITTGEALKQQLFDRNNIPLRKITSIPTGIDLARFKPLERKMAAQSLNLAEDNKYIGIVATLRNWKGHFYLIDAFYKLSVQYPEWTLLIIGDGPQKNNIVKKIDQLGIANKVVLPGNRDDIELWMNVLDIFILPSYGSEGVPQSILQAMACQKAVISTNVGAITEAVIHNQTGLIIEPKNTQQLIHAMTALISDTQKREEFALNGLLRARKLFGIEHMLLKTEEVYKSVMEQ